VGDRIFLLCLIGFPFAISLFFLLARFFRTGVLVFQEGLVFAKDPSLIVAVKWTDIIGLSRYDEREYAWVGRAPIFVGHKRKYTLECARGLHVVLEGLSRMPFLAATIEKRTHPRLMRSALESIEAGNTISFGPLSADKQGLRIGAELVSWDKVRGLDCGLSFWDDTRKVRIVRADKYRTTNVGPPASIVNLHVLKGLVDHFAQAA
jgi:hypothetical protein